MRKFIWSLLLLAAVCAAAWHFWYRLPTPANTTHRALPQVRVDVVTSTQSLEQLPLVAKLKARQSVQLATEVTGRLVRLPPAAGSEVTAGTLLLQLDDAAAQAVLDEADAYLRNEQRKLSDMRRLARSGVVTQNDIEGQLALVAQAEARRNKARTERDQHALRAPFAGRIGLYDLSRGSLLSASTAVLALDDLSVMQLDIPVPEIYLSRLKPGAVVTALTDAWPGETFQGRLDTVDSRIDEQTLTVKARLLFDNPQRRLLPGMLMRLQLVMNQQQLPVIPASAIEFQGEKRFVYLLQEGGSVRRQEVELGSPTQAGIPVLRGLSVGDHLVVEGLVALNDGAKVQVLPPVALPQEQH